MLLTFAKANADRAAPDGLAMSTLRVCNKAGEKVSVALSYRDANESEYFVVRGWFNLDDGECTSQRVVSGSAYVYGASDTGTWDGSAPICIERQQFMRMRTPNYTCGPDELKNFRELNVVTGTLTFNLLDDDSDDDEEEKGD
ncbi:DUF1036 domain-containing protein [Bradyrhizobium sp. 199]|uniref:DUF1036 domain-containing protein n=1 Tax=Bradyrhizobium sp. 199 TaxID=2782664 RepID=UPI001FF8E392|nr:DUF1036 domain-containing protein [Bradyrhizobium sp. 199]MCK1362510.1 DUF1036 domain-containing protein [Bradyrhizobium sp. 199]